MKTFEKNYAKYYDLFYGQKKYNEEANYVVKLLHQNNIFKGNIIDFGCGTGKHDSFLAKNHYNVLGIDISEEMILMAQKENKEIDNLTFLVDDFKNFKTVTEYEAVISLFHVISYQNTYTEINACLKTTYNSLKNNGIFIFDFWNGAGVLTEKPSSKIKKLLNVDEEITRITESDILVNQNIVNVNFEVNIKNKKTKKTETFNELHTMRYWFIPELEYLLSNNGFEVLNSYEWLTTNEPTEKTWYAVMVCKKK